MQILKRQRNKMENLKKDLGKISRNCHMCKDGNLKLVLDLGHHPHSDLFPTAEELNEAEPYFPLRFVLCENCKLFQIDYFVNPDYLYRGDYLYQSSTTKTGRDHYVNMAKDIVKRFGLNGDNLAVDIGSNVGVLLQGFKGEGLKVLGVDPAEVSKKAIENGINTIIDYFNLDIAKKIVKEYQKANVITATNVFAHLHDIDSAVEGIKYLLAEDGVVVIEAPYVVDLLEKLEYDTIYHQHIGYLSVTPMQKYFEKFGLELFDVEKKDIHGGTLRYYVAHTGSHKIERSVKDYLRLEEEKEIYTDRYLQNFAQKAQQQKYDLLELILKLRKQGKKIVGLSAPAKGNTLLNYCHLDNGYLDFITEKNPLKIGRFTPGTHLPILNDEDILKKDVDYALILAWNFADEIMENMAEFKKKSGKFIIPIPRPKII